MVGVAVFHSVMVHGRKQDFTGSPVAYFACPFEQTTFCAYASAVQITEPTFFGLFSINGHHADLRPEMSRNLIDESRVTQGCRVDTHFVGSGIQQPFHVGQFIDTAADGEGDGYFCCYALHHFRECLTAFVAGRNVQIYQFVRPLFAISLAQFHRVSGLAQVHEISSLYRLSVLDIQTGDDTFCQCHTYPLFSAHSANSFNEILPS